MISCRASVSAIAGTPAPAGTVKRSCGPSGVPQATRISGRAASSAARWRSILLVGIEIRTQKQGRR